MEIHKRQLKQAIEQVIEDNFARWSHCEFVKKRKGEATTICLYGTGNFYRNYAQHIKQYDYVCDSNPQKWGMTFDGRICLSPEQLSELESVVVLVMLGDYQDVVERLKKRHIESYFFGDLYLNVYDELYAPQWFESQKEDMLNAVDLFEDDQSKQVYVNAICNRIAPKYAEKTFHEMERKGEYFGTEIFPITQDECYVDIGAYDGDSIRSFMQATDGQFEQIYGFELDPDNYAKIQQDKAIRQDKRIEIFNQGISCGEKMVDIISGGTGSHAAENKAGSAKLGCLDQILEHKRITFIKMDIEGAEQDGLKGAQEIITNQHPKLAISMYHKLDDMWKIPQYIKQLCPDYKLYARHHTAVAWDTDCYAYVE